MNARRLNRRRLRRLNGIQVPEDSRMHVSEFARIGQRPSLPLPQGERSAPVFASARLAGRQW